MTKTFWPSTLVVLAFAGKKERVKTNKITSSSPIIDLPFSIIIPLLLDYTCKSTAFFHIKDLICLYLSHIMAKTSFYNSGSGIDSKSVRERTIRGRLPYYISGILPHQPVNNGHDQPGNSKCDNRGGRYLQNYRNMQDTHQNDTRTGKEICLLYTSPSPRD